MRPHHGSCCWPTIWLVCTGKCSQSFFINLRLIPFSLSYNLREKDISVVNIAYHRFVAVTVGVVWAAIVSRYWWPYEARRELSKALGEWVGLFSCDIATDIGSSFCLNIGWLYTRLVAFNSGEHDAGALHIEEEETPNEETSLLVRSKNTHLNESIVRFMAMWGITFTCSQLF